MNKVTRVKNENFTVISNVFLKDKTLSIKAKGFLAVVMGLPNNWEFSINGVCSILKEGKTAIYNVIDELKETGYCNVVICRDEKGRIIGNDYAFYEEPQIEKQQHDNPYMENPNMDNQPQLNTNSIKDLFDKELKEEIEDKSSTKNIEEFVNKMYAMYPTKCPKRGTSLCKSQKDKQRIKKLLKTYTMEEIEKVFQHEIDEKYDKQYMQNFSTFLNNFPDIHSFEQDLFVEETSKKDDKLIIGGTVYR